MQENRIEAFESFLKLSKGNQSTLNDLFENGGVLSAENVEAICCELSISTEELMISLLPVAESFARAPISSFKVGAITKGKGVDQNGFSSLYLGANFEYENSSLNFSIHAEQSAVSNAWLNDETGIAAIATSAAPCGHCRQFLYELSGTNELPVIIPDTKTGKINSVDIQALLPSAFGPKQLGCDQLLMQITSNKVALKLELPNNNFLVSKTLEQTKLSYAPYTNNYAACGIELNDNSVYFGRYAENVAHNPSLSAFSSAISQVAMNHVNVDLKNDIKRVVFVENATLSSQKKYAELLLSNLSEKTKLEYFQTDLEHRK